LKKFKTKNNYILAITELAKKYKVDSYLVGGCVRDYLLKKDSTDIDIMVVGDSIGFALLCAEHFNTKLSAIYKKFQTALLQIDNLKIEFASARAESYEKNSRKPKIKPADLVKDLSRRDFTINALCYSMLNNYKFIDKFHGYDDLRNKIIRTPLDPIKTFEDDPLRILRAIRFAAKLDFTIEENTFDAMKSMRYRLKNNDVVSQERITNELLLILSAEKPSIGFKLLQKSNILEIIFPELSEMTGIEQRAEYHHKDVFDHTLEVLDNISSKTENIWLKLAALLHDVGKPKTKKFIPKTGWTFHGHEEVGGRMLSNIFRDLKLSNSKLPYVKKLINLHLRPIPLASSEVTDSAIRRLAADAGEELEDLLTLCRADITSKNPEKIKRYLKNFDIVEQKLLDVSEKDKLRNFHSPVRGEEIMKIFKLKPCRKVGIIKKRIEEEILSGKIPNDYEAAKKYLLSEKDSFKNIPDDI
jgi:poly(A) polymerase